MPIELDLSARLVHSVVHRSRHYLQRHFGLETSVSQPMLHAQNTLSLAGYSAVIGLGGVVNIMVVASYDQTLVEHILRRELGEIPLDSAEQETYLGEAASETTNVILGHCTADLAAPGQTVSLSPPVVIQDARSFRRPRDAVFLEVSLQTAQGQLRLNFVGPVECLSRGVLQQLTEQET